MEALHLPEPFVEVTGTFVSFQDLKSLHSVSSQIPMLQLFPTNGQKKKVDNVNLIEITGTLLTALDLKTNQVGKDESELVSSLSSPSDLDLKWSKINVKAKLI